MIIMKVRHGDAMDWISCTDKNRHGPSKQTTHQQGHQTGDLSFFLLIIIYSQQHGHQNGDLLFSIYHNLFSPSWTPDRTPSVVKS